MTPRIGNSRKPADNPLNRCQSLCRPTRPPLKPEQLEIERLRREVAKLKAERDILKKAAAYFARDSI